MAENSSIEWTDHTFNPWIGCMKVSDGCKHCYAETMMDKRYGRVQWGPTGKRIRTSTTNWRQPYQWNTRAAAEGRRYRVFCASLADVFEEKPDQPEMKEWREDLFEMIQGTNHLDWLLLTKRPENVNEMIETSHSHSFSDCEMWFYANPHVWIGTSVEDQKTADERIPHLLKIPATIRFLSCEPLLGPIDLSKWIGAAAGFWAITGGESGPNARPMHKGWVRSLRDQCQAAGIPFLFKQWGEYVPYGQALNISTRSGVSHTWSNYPFDWSKRVGKNRAGRLLDGRTWDEFPNSKEVTQ